jgi:hypothetical protein
MLHGTAACPRCMPMLYVHGDVLAAFMCMLHVHNACACCMSILHVHAACPYCMSMLHVLTACPCCMSILHVHAASHFCISLLHVQGACQRCIVSAKFRRNSGEINLSFDISFRLNFVSGEPYY